jgi:hypothetical protein
MDEYGYTRDRIAIEKQVYFGSTVHEKAAGKVGRGKWDRRTVCRKKQFVIV